LARKILLADDSVTAQNMGRKILADAGYEVITVNNGSAALKKIAELKPDLVILDVYMPGYSGLEVCQRLKESQESSRIPVLLTVGKLEPFKPEEAQRVRAEAFIVKPFEASELLSALSKLEDKVVPRPEPYKPGRFARAMASAEEASRGSRNEPAGEGNGWRSRIAFPHQKTEPQPEENAVDDASIYNPVNRDLRTVVETAAARKAEKDHERQEPKRREAETAAEPSVDVAALAAAGLPKDVTPEEVAAIAAAVVQIKTLESAVNNDNDNDDDRFSAAAGHASPQPHSGQAQDRVLEEMQVRPEVNVAPDSASPVTSDANQSPIEDEHPRQISQPVSEESSQAAQEQDKDKDDKDQDVEGKDKDQPVTMAAATAETAVHAGAGASRWTAVSVPLDAEEAAISLDQEMQKAYSAFVAEETAANEPKAPSESAPPAYSSAPAPTVAEEPSVAAISNPEPEPTAITAQAPDTESSAPPEAIASFSPVEPAGSAEPASASIPPEAAFPAPAAAEVAHVEAHLEPEPSQFSEPIPAPAAESAAEPIASVPHEQQPLPAAELAMAESSSTSQTFTSFVPPQEHKQDHKKKEEQKEEHQQEEHKEDSETVKTTAAAWATWRQIRDTGDAKPAAPESTRQEFDAPAAESAAMAAAAGAEQIPQETPLSPAETPNDVSSIVDSVLADLRPRLMAEISRKMSEKK